MASSCLKKELQRHIREARAELVAGKRGTSTLYLRGRPLVSQMMTLPSTPEVENWLTLPPEAPSLATQLMAFWCLVLKVVSLVVVPRSTFFCHMSLAD